MAQIDPAVRAQAVRLMARWRDDPVAFAHEALAVETWSGPTPDRPGQTQILEAIRDYDQVSIRSGTKSGKTKGLGLAAWWWFTTRPNAQIYMTAPSEETVRDALWKELREIALDWQTRSEAWLERFGVRAATVPIVPPSWIALDPRAGVRSPDGRKQIVVRTTAPSKQQRMAGKSGHESMWIVDEASDYDPALLDAILGNLSGGGKIILCSNPNRQDGKFYDTFHDQAQFWKNLHIRTTDSPNVLAGRMVVPGLVLADKVEEWRKQYGEESEWFRVRVLGEFPKQALDTVFARSALEQSIARTRARAALGA